MLAVFSGTCRIMVRHQEGEPPFLLKTRVELDVSDNLNAAAYKDGEDFTVEGCKAYLRVLVMGIAGMLHYADNKGYVEMKEYHGHIVKILAEAVAQNKDDLEFTNEIF